MKKCSHCKKYFSIKGLVKHCKHLYKGKETQYYYCLSCNCERAKNYRNTRIGRKNINEAVYRSVANNRHKQNARALLNWNVKSGKVLKPDRCQVCKKLTNVNGHHEDYSKPLEVIWVCTDCHRLIHRKLL